MHAFEQRLDNAIDSVALLAKGFKCAMNNKRTVPRNAEALQHRTKCIKFQKHAIGDELLTAVFRLSAPSRVNPVVQCRIKDGVIEPFADRHAGPARGLARGFLRLPPDSFDLPRNARFHARIRTLGQGSAGAGRFLWNRRSLTDGGQPHGPMPPGSQFFIFEVNRRLRFRDAARWN